MSSRYVWAKYEYTVNRTFTFQDYPNDAFPYFADHLHGSSSTSTVTERIYDANTGEILATLSGKCSKAGKSYNVTPIDLPDNTVVVNSNIGSLSDGTFNDYHFFKAVTGCKVGLQLYAYAEDEYNYPKVSCYCYISGGTWYRGKDFIITSSKGNLISNISSSSSSAYPTDGKK